jgi:hypothetical protein
LTSIGTSALSTAIFFYANRYLGWGLLQNLLLATGQGAGYTIGALAAEPVTRRFGRRSALAVIYFIMAMLVLAMLEAPSTPVLVAALLAYGTIAAANWPALESLVCEDADARELSGRVGWYNLVWSSANACSFAISGTIIARAPRAFFLIPAGIHLACAAIMVIQCIARAGAKPQADGESRSESSADARAGADARAAAGSSAHDVPAARAHAERPAPPASPAPPAAPAHPAPEPQLLAARTLAMWLARIALPATYVVIFSVMAMMPTLGVMQPLTTAQRTLIGSIWMAARWVAFLILGATAWWHTRPRLLLLAAAIMLAAFIGVTVRPSELFAAAHASYALDLGSMIFWQIVLGAVLGIIYSASLYFGMVLSEGATEHGGYHEALIGVGCMIGPGAGAATQWLFPGHPRIGVIAVAAVVGVSILAAAAATLRAR